MKVVIDDNRTVENFILNADIHRLPCRNLKDFYRTALYNSSQQKCETFLLDWSLEIVSQFRGANCVGHTDSRRYFDDNLRKSALNNITQHRGSILITTLWIMAILSLFAMGIGFRVSLEVRLSKYNMDRLEALYLAKAGIQKAAELLLKDNNGYDNLYACGVTLTWMESPQDLFSNENNKLGNGSFSVYYKGEKVFKEEKRYYGMQDEERKININTVDETVLQKLSDKITSEIASSILTWRNPNPSPEEDAYYEGLEYPYKCKHDEFTTVEELMFVKGTTKDLFDEIKDYITVHSNGKINVNTAPKEVLNAVINDNEGKYYNLVNKIVNYRKGTDGTEGTRDDRYFVDLNDISDKIMLEVNESARLASLANYFIFKSNNFEITSHGKIGKIIKTVTYIMERNGDGKKTRIKYYHEE